MAYPAVKTTKEDDNVDFSFLQRQFLHISSSVQAEALEREIFLRSALGAECHELLSRIKRKKETLNVLLLLEKTRIRNVRRTSKHFPTTEVDFLTIKVVLRIMRTITVFLNATDDFRTESERLAYGSRHYMQFSVFGGADEGGGGVRARTLNSPYLRNG